MPLRQTGWMRAPRRIASLVALGASASWRAHLPLHRGVRLGPYEVLSPLGAGGMGVVYRARHLRLQRDVALKVLPDDVSSDDERLRRLEREAHAASSLNHPNIVTIYDIDEQEGTRFIAMELVEGCTLREIVGKAPLPVEQILSLARQMADGLGRAHAANIIHRDFKPENVMVTGDGLVKILDFGLAKVAHGDPASELNTASAITRRGVLTGTLQYMAPEQISGNPSDHRSDQFSYGVVLYEMLCGRRPFDGPSHAAILAAIVRETPPAPRALRADLPKDLEGVVTRCLEKDPARRHPSMAETTQAIVRCQERLAEPATRRGVLLRRPVVAALVVALVVVVGVAARLWVRVANERWVRDALPEITRLTESGDLYAAYRLVLEAERRVPGDARLRETLNRITLPISVVTKPAGALVEVKGYRDAEASWQRLGETPLETRIPYALLRWKISKAGFETFEGAPFGVGPFQWLGSGFPLQAEGSRPAGTVAIPGGEVTEAAAFPLPPVKLDDYWLDRFEVTNREYQAFVDRGGYAQREYWTEPFVDQARELTWEEAMSRFRDATGRPGPAGWELGVYPAGRDDHPVGGVSWFEAAAYCAFAGKSLPSIYHWYNANRQDQVSDIVLSGNFGPDGPAPVGSSSSLGDYGTYDMAGNVKEWSWNRTASGDKRYILGGGWGEPTYQYRNPDARQPFERLPTHGVRCARYAEPPEGRALASLDLFGKPPQQKPVEDDVFEAYRGIYEYPPASLEASVERVDDSQPYWRKEVVSFAAAYGGERVTALLFLPRNAAPPYQSVIWLPGTDAFGPRSSDTLASAYLFDFIPRSGRALVYPVYKGYYERRVPPEVQRQPADLIPLWYKDFARTLDYLETREDFDRDRFAYYGFSVAWTAPIFSALDPRIKASVMLAGGMPRRTRAGHLDPINFAPRNRAPTLMINGRDDFIMPVETHQRPLFQLLGAPEGAKRHVVLDGGHLPPDRRAIIKEVLEWLDRYLGPVAPPKEMSPGPRQ